jgi:hypothetical protein
MGVEEGEDVMSEILRAKGQNGQVEFDSRNVTIKRGGF